jgi:DNA-binding HxlR family transcriptional regulator
MASSNRRRGFGELAKSWEAPPTCRGKPRGRWLPNQCHRSITCPYPRGSRHSTRVVIAARLLPISRDHKASAKTPVFKRISEKWSLQILATLQMSPMHFLALQRSVTGVSKKVLCETLRHLERDGLVTRRPEIHQFAVEYSLTGVGQSLCTALEALHQWAAENGTAIEKSRQRFDAAHRGAHTERSGSDRALRSDALANSSHWGITETTPLSPRSHRSVDSQRSISSR